MAEGGLDAGFQEALDRMMAAAPGPIGVISGWRSFEQQTQLYKSKGPGMAAKPGTSWHERGLAGDLRFATNEVRDWAHAHAAEFGLFFPMAWEPWHVQPLWTQGRRSSQTDVTGGVSAPPADYQPEATATDPMGNLLGTVHSMVTAGTDSSEFPAETSDIASRWSNVMGLGGTGGGFSHLTGQSLDWQRAYDLVIQQGGTPDEARFLASVAEPESGYSPTAHNGTGRDNSYGLWQVNMKDDDPANPNMGKKRAEQWGLSSYDELFNPATNARAALDIYRSQGKDAWHNSVVKLGL